MKQTYQAEIVESGTMFPAWWQRTNAGSVKTTAVSLLVGALLTPFTACGTRLTVPAQDPTPPTAVLDLHFPQNRIFTVTSAGFNPTLPAELNGGEEISLVAKCTDGGGCQNIQIFVNGTTTNSDGSVTPLALRQPLNESPDAAAKPGGTALPERLVSGKLDIPQLRGSGAALVLNVTAVASNAHGASDRTRRLILFWSRPVPLVVSPCPRFGPVGGDPPMVLDSRGLSVEILKLMNTDPTKTTFTIAIVPPGAPAGHTFRITVVEGTPPPGGPTTASFRLRNSTGETRQASTVDSRNCGAAGRLMTAGPNSTSSFVQANITNTTTVVFSSGGADIAIWNEIPFWQAFGGRTTTFQWLQAP